MSGTQLVKLVTGMPYPLTVGGTWVYTYEGQNSRGDRWSGELHCEVAGAAKPTLAPERSNSFQIWCCPQCAG